jgi:hypothetical protein
MLAAHKATASDHLPAVVAQRCWNPAMLSAVISGRLRLWSEVAKITDAIDAE